MPSVTEAAQPKVNIVQRLHDHCKSYRRNADNAKRLKKQIEEAETNLRLTMTDLECARKEIASIVEQLDCSSVGNYGWDQRIPALLAELTAQDLDVPTQHVGKNGHNRYCDCVRCDSTRHATT